MRSGLLIRWCCHGRVRLSIEPQAQHFGSSVVARHVEELPRHQGLVQVEVSVEDGLLLVDRPGQQASVRRNDAGAALDKRPLSTA